MYGPLDRLAEVRKAMEGTVKAQPLPPQCRSLVSKLASELAPGGTGRGGRRPRRPPLAVPIGLAAWPGPGGLARPGAVGLALVGVSHLRLPSIVTEWGFAPQLLIAMPLCRICS